MALIVTIANQKGGVGKTITSINLAAALGAQRCKTLLVDMDPQGHSSLSFIDKLDGRLSIQSVFRGEASLVDVIRPVTDENIDILPSSIALSKVERDLVTEIDGHFKLKDLIVQVAGDYDFVIIDTPPALGMLTINCLVATDYVIIPIQSSYLSLEGTDDLLETIQKIRNRFNPKLRILGALITIHDRRTILGKDIKNRIKEVFSKQVFSTIIHRAVRLEECPAYRESIFRYAPKSASAEEYRRLGKEVIKRVGTSRSA